LSGTITKTEKLLITRQPEFYGSLQKLMDCLDNDPNGNPRNKDKKEGEKNLYFAPSINFVRLAGWKQPAFLWSSWYVWSL